MSPAASTESSSTSELPTGTPCRLKKLKAMAPPIMIRDKTGFSYLGETDAAGLFVIVARLGDESAGEGLTLRLGDARTRLTARFDPANHSDERGTRVDFEGARVVERRTWFRSTLANFLSTTRR